MLLTTHQPMKYLYFHTSFFFIKKKIHQSPAFHPHPTALSRSSEAPVVIFSTNKSSAARPPKATAILSRIACWANGTPTSGTQRLMHSKRAFKQTTLEWPSPKWYLKSWRKHTNWIKMARRLLLAVTIVCIPIANAAGSWHVLAMDQRPIRHPSRK